MKLAISVHRAFVRGPLPAILLLAVASTLGCGSPPEPTPLPSSPTPRSAAVSSGNPGPSAAGEIAPAPAISTAGTREAAEAAPSATPPPATSFDCPSGPCPTSLEYAVNGCSCAGQTYTEATVSQSFCCASGFSDTECPESLQQQARLESLLGSTEAEIEAQLVWVDLQSWPVQVHEQAAAAFEQAAKNIENSSYRIVEPMDGFYYRNVEGHSVLSLHSFGIAVDINPSSNPSCGTTVACRCYNDLITDMPPDFVEAFKSAGFDWGGDWKEHPDPMHFEWNGWH